MPIAPIDNIKHITGRQLLQQLPWVLAVVCMALASAIKYSGYVVSGFDDGRAAQTTITRQLNQQQEAVSTQTAAIVSILKQKEPDRFSQLNTVFATQQDLPVQIFSNGKPYYWSTTKYLPPYTTIAGKYNNTLLYLQNYRAIVFRDTLTIDGNLLEVYTHVPLFRRYSIASPNLISGWQIKVFSEINLSTKAEDTTYLPINLAASKTPLFYVSVTNRPIKINTVARYSTAGLIAAGLLLFGLQLIIWFQLRLSTNKANWLDTLPLFIYLPLARAALLFAELPQKLVSLSIFNPSYFKDSILAPSVADYLLTAVCALGMAIVGFIGIYNFGFPQKILRQNAWVRALISFFGLIIIIGYSLLLLDVAQLSYRNTGLNIDLTAGIGLSLRRYIMLSATIAWLLSGFFIIDIGLRLLFKPLPFRRAYLTLGFIAIAAFCAITFKQPQYCLIIITLVVYIEVVLRFNLTKYLYVKQYPTYVYYFSYAVVAACICAIGLYSIQQTTAVKNRIAFATQIVAETDPLTETLLAQIQSTIETDTYIKQRLTNLFPNPDIIADKVKKTLEDPNFNLYDIQITVYNAAGNPINSAGNLNNYTTLKDALNRPQYKTSKPQIYFINQESENTFKRYICLTDIRDSNYLAGHIAIDLRLKKSASLSAFPDAIAYGKSLSQSFNGEFSLAVYGKDGLIFSSGPVNYDRVFNQNWLTQTSLYTDGLQDNGLLHVGVKGTAGRAYILTTPVYPLKHYAANFSFILLLLVGISFVLISLYLASRLYQGAHLNLATKIQLYLNAAFIIPLLAVSIVIISVMRASYAQNLEKDFLAQATHIGTVLQQYIVDASDAKISTDALQAHIAKVSYHAGQDINLFSPSGKLELSSQPIIYTRQLYAPFASPIALAEVVEARRSNTILTDKIGQLDYRTAYIAIRSGINNHLYGILSVPFFNGNVRLQQQVADVVVTIINAFAALIILFVGISFYASKQLVVPLKMLTNRLRRTSLTRSLPLQWVSNDEIGLLVRTYNAMLLKLQESGANLRATEKESAWREMAQQVAHEIKNPLTPMQLTLQYLERAIANDNPNILALTQKAVTSLLTQIETLSNIASSFSAFAQMPLPQTSIFDLEQLLTEVTTLFSGKEEGQAQINLDFHTQNTLLEADRKLIGRIFNNLVLNAIQAKKPDNQPVNIKIYTQTQGQNVLIAFQDNGTGIPPAIQDKVFTPNFSTKRSGTGIGLAVAKRGIEQMGGKIWFQTLEGLGTTFFIEMVQSEQAP